MPTSENPLSPDFRANFAVRKIRRKDGEMGFSEVAYIGGAVMPCQFGLSSFRQSLQMSLPFTVAAVDFALQIMHLGPGHFSCSFSTSVLSVHSSEITSFVSHSSFFIRVMGITNLPKSSIVRVNSFAIFSPPLLQNKSAKTKKGE